MAKKIDEVTINAYLENPSKCADDTSSLAKVIKAFDSLPDKIFPDVTSKNTRLSLQMVHFEFLVYRGQYLKATETLFKYLSPMVGLTTFISQVAKSESELHPFIKYLIADEASYEKIKKHIGVFVHPETGQKHIFAKRDKLGIYESQPVTKELLEMLGIPEDQHYYDYVNSQNVYYKKGDLTYYAYNERTFELTVQSARDRYPQVRTLSLAQVINEYEECDDCGIIHNHRHDDCPACGHFKKLNGYTTQVQEVLAPHITERHYGIEIEVEGVPHGEQNKWVKDASNVEKRYLLCKSDGSLQDGVELVTKPASYAEHLERMPKVLGSVRYETSSRTGMHVHANIDLVNQDVLLHLFKDRKMWKIVDHVSDRPKDYHYNGRYAMHNDNLSPNRYHVFHAGTGKGTVEFRMFGTPKNVEQFKKNMEFVKACVDFSNSRVHNIDIAQQFINFVHNEVETYPLTAAQLTSGKFKKISVINTPEQVKPKKEKKVKIISDGYAQEYQNFYQESNGTINYARRA